MTSSESSSGKHNQTVALSRKAISEKLGPESAWVISNEGTRISRSIRMKNFVQALRYFNRIGKVAEAENHHPDLHLTGYRNVKVELWTHTLGGVSEADVAMAKKIDAVPQTP